MPCLAPAPQLRMNGGTNIAVAIHKAGQLLKRHAHEDAIRHIVLITDGRVDSYQAREVGGRMLGHGGACAAR